jgi:hypothetical protein
MPAQAGIQLRFRFEKKRLDSVGAVMMQGRVNFAATDAHPPALEPRVNQSAGVVREFSGKSDISDIRLTASLVSAYCRKKSR